MEEVGTWYPPEQIDENTYGIPYQDPQGEWSWYAQGGQEDLGFLQDRYNTLTGQYQPASPPAALPSGAGGLPPSSLPLEGPYPTMQLYNPNQYNNALQMAQLAYYNKRMELLEIPEAMRLDERERQRIAITAAVEYMRQLGYMVTPQQVNDLLAGKVVDMRQGIPTLEREQYTAQLMANPRTLPQTLLFGGMNQAQAAEVLNQLPLVKSLTQMAMPGWEQAPPRQPGPAGGGPAPAVDTSTRNPLFPFIAGRHLPARQAVGWLESNSPMVPLLSGLASFSGQEPEAFWGDFQAALPKGGAVPLTRMG